MTDIKKSRGRVLRGRTVAKETPSGEAFVILTLDDRGQPFEVFCNVGKAGSDIAAVSEAIGRLISFTLRMSPELTPSERLQEIVDQLAGIGGERSLGFGPQRVRSLPDGIAQALKEAIGLQELSLAEALSDDGLPQADPPPTS